MYSHYLKFLPAGAFAMLRKIVFAGVILFAGASANAAEPLAKGLYAGGSFGASVFDDDGAFFGLDFDDTDTAFQGHLGYKFLKFFAIEGRVTNYGTFDLESLGLDATAVSLHGVGIVPFGTSGWELFGQLGVGSVKIDVDGTDETETSFAGGIGVRYYATQNLSIGVQTDVHVWEEESLGFSLTPGVGATQFTVQFIF